ncbi:MAG: redoxin domain-containing protein [Pirellulaceae bacterium]|nr:redoxin domain-containing protein [Pirellulaceae bacterium]
MKSNFPLSLIALLGVCFSFLATAAGQTEVDETEAVLAGHSYHGEAFNEGPRQQAYLMPGLGQSQFLISTKNAEAQQFFNQGVDQLHGFWYLEAERSFRQVAVLDPHCVMAFWGLAMANVNNEKRARKFIQKGLQEIAKDAEPSADVTEREKLYIEALATLYDEKTKEKKKRHEKYTKKLEEIVLTFPNDIEGKAFLVYQIWMNSRAGIPISSHVAVNSLLDQIFEANPTHPSHHYRIHLWDYRKAEVALESAAKCGPALPDIAHMWHMPGHIYSKLKRYPDAVWQQEASARIDHRHMMHDRVLPDQIHNFAHNNEWCVRNLNHIGRVDDAIDLATNMVSMPRHPKYNHLENRGSTWYGRKRLFETLSRYERWQDLIDLCHTPVLEPTDDSLEQINRLRHLGRAYYRTADKTNAANIQKQLEDRKTALQQTESEQLKEAINKVNEQTAAYRKLSRALSHRVAAEWQRDLKHRLNSTIRRDHQKRLAEAKKVVGKKTEKEMNVLRRALDEMAGYQLLAEEKYIDAEGKFSKAGSVDAIYRARCFHLAGDTKKAVDRARKYVKSHPFEVQPQANLVSLLWEAGEKEAAQAEFEKLCEISASIDLSSQVFTRLQPIAEHCGFDTDWRVADEPCDDLGSRPDIASLGPFRWSPSAAPEWELVDSQNDSVAAKQFQGQPVVLIFYLGHGCLHCAEQLQEFAPQQRAFLDAGIEMVAISTDDQDGLKKSLDSYGDVALPIRLVANPDLDVFKRFRAFDEFENQPLHGTFLIDAAGRVRWQDISYEPFMDAEFLLKESQRLLGQNID